MTYKNFVLPKVYLTGYTSLNYKGITQYLTETGQLDFAEDIVQAKNEGLDEGEILCSMYAKLCYASLTTGKNKNISKVRSIYDNIIGTIDSGHGSVFEHCSINFIVHNCSRIYTHEQVRHRVGTGFSQTSGRYVRSDELKIVVDPILEKVYSTLDATRGYIESQYKIMEEEMMNGVTDMKTKKKITSALRRILPNAQANELGLTVNLRGLRQQIEARTSEHAEWEIRYIFNQIYEMLLPKYPAIFMDSKSEEIDGLNQITFKNKKI